jgi:signal transduction histidine kinase
LSERLDSVVGCEDVTELRRALAQVAETREQLRDLRAELPRAVEREQRRIARVLHDELGQALAAARMAICRLREAEISAAKLERLEEARSYLDQAIEVTRSFTFQLSPPILHDLGLAAALQALGERTEREHGIRFAFAIGNGWSPPGEDAGVVLYRVLRELLHNVTKHARARSVRLELAGRGQQLRIALADDGVGFEAVQAGRAGRNLGLFHVREQMARLGGRFAIDSVPGRGTHVTLSLPRAQAGGPVCPPGRGSP